jgi:hypothetical protein
MLLYDPPSGWQYGFPKPYLPRPNEQLQDTLIRDGYPPELASKFHDRCRFIGRREELDTISEGQ